MAKNTKQTDAKMEDIASKVVKSDKYSAGNKRSVDHRCNILRKQMLNFNRDFSNKKSVKYMDKKIDYFEHQIKDIKNSFCMKLKKIRTDLNRMKENLKNKKCLDFFAEL